MKAVSVRQNKFARRAQDRQQGKQLVARDAPPSVEEQLTRLEDDIRRLKVEFDIYFNGGTKRPPYDTKGRVETLIKRLGDERGFNFAQRYHYNSLVARYTAFRDLWRRTILEREEGRTHAPTRVNGASTAALAAINAGGPSVAFVCADARADVPTIKSLYDALVDAKRLCGEPTDNFTFSQFHRLVVAKTETLKERLGCDRVRFSVAVENGQVSFKAKAEK